jgi:NADPH-dependent curcumin reductase
MPTPAADLTALTNTQLRLASRPVGLPTRDNWRTTHEPVAEPAAGGVLVKTLYLSLDPAMRGWMNDVKSYIPPVGIDEVMRAGGIGVVVASKNPGFAVGDMVSAVLGVQSYALIPEDQVKRSGVFRIDPAIGSPTQWLNVLGMPGMTAYFGLLDVGQPKPGDTVVVSGAAGAVGQTVGQLAKVKGCRAVGIAGGKAKCDWVVNELGFDACIDYKGGSVRDGLKQHCPDGVDVYFDNVGGEILDAVLANLADGARIALCGAISGYNDIRHPVGLKNTTNLIVKCGTMRGFLVMQFAARYGAAIAELAEWAAAGKIKSEVDVVEGLENAPAALRRLFAGENLGKQLVKVAAP